MKTKRERELAQRIEILETALSEMMDLVLDVPIVAAEAARIDDRVRIALRTLETGEQTKDEGT